MTRLLLLAMTMLLADSALASGPFVTTLPAQRLACTSGESSVASATSESLKALRTRAVQAKINRTGFPFFLKAEPVEQLPTVAPAEIPAAQATEQADLPADERLSWQVCVPIDNREVDTELEIVEASSKSVVVLIVLDLETSCAERLEAHLAEALGEKVTRPPRSLPIFQLIDASSAEAKLEPFLTSEALEAAELTSFGIAAKVEQVDHQLTGDLGGPRPLFASSEESEHKASPIQVGVICLVEIPENVAEDMRGR